MKTQQLIGARPARTFARSCEAVGRAVRAVAAFTLIELLVVIAVIAVLASMIFPVTGAVNRFKIKSRSLAELGQLQSAIADYKTKVGHYPPDNPTNPSLNQLYWELSGTKLNQGVYTTLDGASRINETDVPLMFGGVAGFVNSTKGGGGDESGNAENFLKAGLKPNQTHEVDGKAKVLVGVPYQKLGSGPFSLDPIPGVPNQTANPWRYRMTNPTNNPSSYDLWLDVIIGGKAYRICNWSRDMLRINTP